MHFGDKPYNHSLTLSDLIKPDQSKKIFSTLFTKPFLLIDLTTIEDDTLRNQAQHHIKGVALLMALKHASDRQIEAFFTQVFAKILKQLALEGGTDEVVDVLYYLLKESVFLDKDRFFEIFKFQQFSSEVENKMSTVAQQLQEEAIEKNKIEIAKQLLNEKIGLSNAELIALIKRLTGLPDEKIQKLPLTQS